MIRLLFVGDGQRDAALGPALVGNLLRAEVQGGFRAWARVNAAGKGYDRKLLFALRQARDDGYAGVVATIDRDSSRGSERLRSLKRGLERDRFRQAPLPTALGCADPHAEAWLLDDPVAVREALGLPGSHAIPSVARESDPKRALQALHDASGSGASPSAVCAAIAARLVLARCAQRRATGLASFATEVEVELGPLRGRSA